MCSPVTFSKILVNKWHMHLAARRRVQLHTRRRWGRMPAPATKQLSVIEHSCALVVSTLNSMKSTRRAPKARVLLRTLHNRRGVCGKNGALVLNNNTQQLARGALYLTFDVNTASALTRDLRFLRHRFCVFTAPLVIDTKIQVFLRIKLRGVCGAVDRFCYCGWTC